MTITSGTSKVLSVNSSASKPSLREIEQVKRNINFIMDDNFLNTSYADAPDTPFY